MVPLNAFCNKYSADIEIKVNVQIASQQKGTNQCKMPIYLHFL